MITPAPAPAPAMKFSQSFRFLLLLIILPVFLPSLYAAEDSVHRSGRSLMGFKETFGNATYDCSPAGPCVACRYSEKNDENYRCSETGYRIPLKCLRTAESTNGSEQKGRSVLESSRKLQASLNDVKSRKLLRDSTISHNKEESYITYRSCVPTISEENLTVLGFEGIMLFMLAMSGTVLYFRRKHTVSMPNGSVRIPTNPRF